MGNAPFYRIRRTSRLLVVVLWFAAVDTASAQQIGREDAAEGEHVSQAIACLERSESQYDGFSNCIGSITDACLTAASGRISGLECYDLEAAVWANIYNSSSNELFRVLEDAGRSDGVSGLREALNEWERSLGRQCAYLSGRWGDEGTERQDNGYQCVRDASAERAITLFFWLDHARHFFLGEAGTSPQSETTPSVSELPDLLSFTPRKPRP